jgi:hypothetical protein
LEPVNEDKAEREGEWVGYYPESGEFLPDGRLRVKTSGRTDGEIWDGYIESAPRTRFISHGQSGCATRTSTLPDKPRRSARRVVRGAGQGEPLPGWAMRAKSSAGRAFPSG